jgi:hypothetical protein
MVVTTAVFVRALGLIYLIAFLSLRVQLLGLFGSHGILPIAEYSPASRRASVPSATGCCRPSSGSTPATARCSALRRGVALGLAVDGGLAPGPACSRSGRSISRSSAPGASS